MSHWEECHEEEPFVGCRVGALALCAPASAELKFKPGEDPKFNWANFDEFKKVDLKGQTLTIFGPWRGEDETLVRSVLAYFTEATGVDVKYSSSENYEQQIVIDTQAGSPPNIAILPQPGLIADLASKGFLTPLGDDIANWRQGQLRRRPVLGRPRHLQGQGRHAKLLRLPLQDRREVAGLVRAGQLRGCRLRSAEDHGRAQGADREDRRRRRHAVVHRPRFGRRDRLAGDRLGRGHDAAHPAAGGLRQVGHERDSVQRSAVVAAHRRVRLVRQERQISSMAAPQAVATTDFRDSPKGLFASPPKCYMHHQASFIPSFFPEGTKLGEDADFFYCPPYAAKPDLGKPVLGAGTLAIITKDSPAARAFIDFLKTPIAHEIWMAQSRLPDPVQGASTWTPMPTTR